VGVLAVLREALEGTLRGCAFAIDDAVAPLKFRSKYDLISPRIQVHLRALEQRILHTPLIRQMRVRRPLVDCPRSPVGAREPLF
jgi:hypothetical protein